MNPITGEKKVSIGGTDYVLRFTWRALAEVEHKYGQTPDLFNPDVLAGVAECGFRERHPELTADKLMAMSPPLVVFAKAVQEAIHWACFGAGPIPEATEKKSHTKADGWLGRFGSALRKGLRRQSFGA